MQNWDNLIKEALKSKNSLKLKTYRNIKTEIQKFKTAPGFQSYGEQEELQILKNIIKNLKKSEEAYFQVHRQDLVADCVAEREVVETFLPKAPDTKDLKLALESSNFVEKSNDGFSIFIKKQNMSKVIKELKDKFPLVNGKDIATLVKTYVC